MSEDVHVDTGEMLVSWSATVDVFVWNREPALVNQHIFRVVPDDGLVDKAFLFHWLKVAIDQLLDSEHLHGSTMKHINRGPFLAHRIPLPPLREQQRIAEALEELLSDLDAGVAELKAAQRKLAQYRQSLLKAAVQGELTADWRAAQRNPQETGAELLQRILTERRARWEQKQLAKFAEQGKTPSKGWQAKYSAAAQPDTSSLPPLPENWVWTSLDCLIEDGPQNGLYVPSEKYGRGAPILRIDDYQIGWSRQSNALSRVDTDAATSQTYALKAGDLVINRVNSMTHLGKCICIQDSMEGVLFESNLMRLSLSRRVSAKFFELYLGSLAGRARLIKDAKWAVNQASINQQDVRRTAVPLPPYQEQITAVEILGLQYDVIDAQLATVVRTQKQSVLQRKNLLKAAFSGELVSQDLSDEPASVLLARVRAARATRTVGKRGRKAKSTT